AIHDVADQISSTRSVVRQQREQDAALTSAEAAYDLATQRYRAGLGSYLTVLNAETNVIAQRRLTTDLRARAIDSQMLLVRALGGGYAAGDDTRALASAGLPR
ncbi:MAG TPA: TolC family protein, partial [Caldimonas sp.]|nr:TolC family protein [Caldimonas sp.]